MVGADAVDQRLIPVRLDENPGDYISDVNDAGKKEDFFDAAVIPFDGEKPDSHGCDGD